MKQRITYLRNGTDPVSDNAFKVTHAAFIAKELNAAKEHIITLEHSELPDEIRAPLKHAEDLSIRWASTKPYIPLSPLTSRVSPGLHVLYTPLNRTSDNLPCSPLKDLFGSELQCDSVQESFIEVPGTPKLSSQSRVSQYYHLAPSLDALIAYISERLCSPGTKSWCAELVSLQTASYLDLDYNKASGSVVVKAFWDGAPGDGRWDERIEKLQQIEKVEVGVLHEEKAIRPNEVSLGGILTVLGQDRHPAPTRFSFPARHHATASSASYSASFPPPTGLHPTFRLSLQTSSFEPPSNSCALHAYATLPSSLFVDKYQLSDSLFLASNNLKGIKNINGETDLENPDWVIQKWGSALLLELASPTKERSSKQPQQKRDTQTWDVDIPLHLRYLPPNRGKNGIEHVHVPWPVVFWACNSTKQVNMAGNPFDRTRLGYDSLFGPDTVFHHWQPRPAENATLVETVRVPVLDLDRSKYVEFGTAVAVLLGFGWACWKLFVVVSRSGIESNKRETTKKDL